MIAWSSWLSNSAGNDTAGMLFKRFQAIDYPRSSATYLQGSIVFLLSSHTFLWASDAFPAIALRRISSITAQNRRLSDGLPGIGLFIFSLAAITSKPRIASIFGCQAC
jgi:hypothetical protein